MEILLGHKRRVIGFALLWIELKSVFIDMFWRQAKKLKDFLVFCAEVSNNNGTAIPFTS